MALGQRQPASWNNAGGYVPPRLPTPPAILARGKSEDEPLPPAPAAATTQAPTQAPAPAPTWTALPVATTAAVMPVTLPKPGELGLNAAPSAAEWTVPLSKLEALGATLFAARENPSGGWTFVCHLRTSDQNRRLRIEAGPVPTKAEAIRLALVEAERQARK
jgi:hypothetical protein